MRSIFNVISSVLVAVWVEWVVWVAWVDLGDWEEVLFIIVVFVLRIS